MPNKSQPDFPAYDCCYNTALYFMNPAFNQVKHMNIPPICSEHLAGAQCLIITRLMSFQTLR